MGRHSLPPKHKRHAKPATQKIVSAVNKKQTTERLLLGLSIGAMFTVGIVIAAPLSTPRSTALSQVTLNSVPESPTAPTQDTTTPPASSPAPSDSPLTAPVPSSATTTPSRSSRSSATISAPRTTTPAPTPRRTPTPEPQPEPQPAPQVVSSSKCVGIGVASNVRDACNRIVSNVSGIGVVGGVGQRGNASCHPGGLALDLFASRSVGDAIASYALNNKSSLDISSVIWRQRINFGSGWNSMEDRGTITANHYDHVHISFLPCTS